MTAPISYSYTVTAPDMAEAMLLAGAGAGGAMWRKGAAILVSILYGVMMVLGGGGLAFLAVLLITGQAGSAGFPFLIGGAFGGAFAVLWYQSLIRLMARDIVAKPFNSGEQEITLTPEGMTLRTAHTEWRTDWAAVHNVRAGRLTLTFCVSGIALFVPLAAVGDKAALSALTGQIAQWRGE